MISSISKVLTIVSREFRSSLTKSSSMLHRAGRQKIWSRANAPLIAINAAQPVFSPWWRIIWLTVQSRISTKNCWPTYMPN